MTSGSCECQRPKFTKTYEDHPDLNLASWPRGLYELGLPKSGRSELWLEFDPEDQKEFNTHSNQGVVLVTRGSGEYIEGSVFVEGMERVKKGIPLIPPAWRSAYLKIRAFR